MSLPNLILASSFGYYDIMLSLSNPLLIFWSTPSGSTKFVHENPVDVTMQAPKFLEPPPDGSFIADFGEMDKELPKLTTPPVTCWICISLKFEVIAHKHPFLINISHSLIYSSCMFLKLASF